MGDVTKTNPNRGGARDTPRRACGILYYGVAATASCYYPADVPHDPKHVCQKQTKGGSGRVRVGVLGGLSGATGAGLSAARRR